MAVIPDVNISTRQIETAPSPHYYQSLKGENGRIIGSTISTAGNALDRIWEVQRRERERARAEAERAQRAHDVSINRDGENLNNIFENYIANEAIGRIEQDPVTGQKREIKGRWSTTYSDMQGSKTSLPKITDEIFAEFKESDDYKNATPEVRAAFERKAKFVKDRWTRKAMETQERLRVEDSIKKQKENEEFYAKAAAATYGSKAEVTDPRTGAKMPAFQYAANEMGLKTFAGKMGSLVANPETMDNPTARFDDIKWTDNPDESELSRRRDAYQAEVRKIYVNRITALQSAGANGMGLGDYRTPQDCLAEADRMTDEMLNTKMNRKGIDGKPMTMIDENQANAVKSETAKARKKLEAIRVELNKDEYNGCLAQVGEVELDLCNPKKVVQTGNGLNYEAYCADLAAKHPNLSQEQSIALRKQYRQLCDYYDKYTADLAKHTKNVTDAENKQKSEYGWFKEDGSFVPSSAFPKDSDSTSWDEFNEESAIWQNTKTAMARLEAARMTGRLSESDYRRYYSYGTMMMDIDAQKWWFKNYGKFDIAGLTKTEYGETDVKKDIRKSRDRGNYSAASGIFAANRGVAKTYKNAADFVADTLEQDSGKNEGNESLVPIETLPKVYDTIRRFARAGVDPADAVRAILQPALQQGISLNLTERLSDPDYFNSVVEDFKVNGTHFTDTSIEQAAAGVGTNWYKDRKQAVTSDLVRQGRLKVGK